MRIGFDATSLAKPESTGIASYGIHLITALLRLAPEHEYSLFLRPHRWRRIGLLKDRFPNLVVRPLMDRVAGLVLREVDVLHALGARLPERGLARRVATIHDIHAVESPELVSAERSRSRAMRLRQTIQRADAIISLSEQGKTALKRYFQVPDAKIQVIPSGVNFKQFSERSPDDGTLSQLGLHHRPYVLSVGPYGRRKNQVNLLRAFVKANLPDEWLVIMVGAGNSKEEVSRDASELGLAAEKVRWLGWLPDPAYRAVLQGARTYACPSMHEGFGLPILEAQAAGVPVIAARRAAIPETVGAGGLLIDPEDVEEFADALRSLCWDEKLREKLRASGRQRAQALSWMKTSEETLAVYRKLASMDSSESIS